MDANDTSCFFSADGPTLSRLESLTIIEGSSSGLCDLFILERDGRRRVLKCLKPKYRGLPAYEALLRKEYEIGMSLSSPHICEVYAYLDHPELGPCIEMEWIDGVPLNQYLSLSKPTALQRTRLLNQLFDAVSYFHSKQVVHKDLKPSNILVTRNGANIKIIDFGFADSDSHSILKLSAGTREYAAPELIAGEQVDTRADIWSLGKMLSLFGHQYHRVAGKCMREEPSKRYASVEELRRAASATRLRWLWPVAAILAVGIVTGFALTPGKSSAPIPAKTIQCSVEEAPVTHLWRKGDQILISDKKHRPVYEATKSGRSVSFRWDKKNTSSLITDGVGYFAYYPTTIIFKLPAVQEYAEGGPSLVPMMAHFLNTYSETFNPKFLFKNVCGVIRLNLTTNQPGVVIQSVVFHSEQPLCGRYRVNQDLKLRFTDPQDLTLSCPEVPVGENPTSFYVSVPPQDYETLTLTIHTADGRTATWSLPQGQPLTVLRAEIATLDVVCNDFQN